MRAGSPADQQTQHFRQDLLCVAGELGRGGAGQGVRDEREGVLGSAVGLRDGPAVGNKEMGADGRRRNTAPL